jgi:porphobilinogen deaminase
MPESIKVACHHNIRQDVYAKLKEEYTLTALSHPLSDWSEVSSLLNDGDYDACLMELKNIPYDKGYLKIAALISIDVPQYYLVVNKEKVCRDCDLKLASGSVVGVPSEYVSRQIGYLNPSLSCMIIPELDGMSPYDVTACDAFVISSQYMEGADMAQSDIFPIHRTEIWPETGAGILALVTHSENRSAFRSLRLRHERSISDVTNPARLLCRMALERGVKEVEAYCQTDSSGHYHLYAARFDGQLQRHRISQSTHDLLPERMLSALNL